jgi:hypothetical protein
VLQLNWVGGQIEQSRSPTERLLTYLVLFLACFLTSPLAGERGFDALFLARFQVKGVALDLLDDIFLLHFTLESAQCILEGFSLLKPYFRQTYTPPDSSGRTE